WRLAVIVDRHVLSTVTRLPGTVPKYSLVFAGIREAVDVALTVLPAVVKWIHELASTLTRTRFVLVLSENVETVAADVRPCCVPLAGICAGVPWLRWDMTDCANSESQAVTFDPPHLCAAATQRGLCA